MSDTSIRISGRAHEAVARFSKRYMLNVRDTAEVAAWALDQMDDIQARNAILTVAADRNAHEQPEAAPAKPRRRAG